MFQIYLIYPHILRRKFHGCYWRCSYLGSEKLLVLKRSCSLGVELAWNDVEKDAISEKDRHSFYNARVENMTFCLAY
jgi:hypothetical protein